MAEQTLLCHNCGEPAAWDYRDEDKPNGPPTFACDNWACKPRRYTCDGRARPVPYNAVSLPNVHGKLATLREHLINQFSDVVCAIEADTPEHELEAVLEFTRRLPGGRAFDCNEWWEWLEEHRSRLEPAEV